MFEDNDGRTYEVVRNSEEQYSVWPAGRALPAGWERVGGSGSKADCLTLIDGLWSDLRPKSVRERAVAR
ncbi:MULTISPECIES: MbtH family protein [unclassified Streptomyces]|uniref:MbtH family protein n=1 Tax=unclassified Streptomyces TaxID=2593676 RepID=UPI00299FA2A2|nr:MbtH family NRPS accessory protein [Streptomyces sp. PA03-2a]MDX2733441.1 MbtH family NRPS accessory protein [Streptomyces sp. PA03-2a]